MENKQKVRKNRGRKNLDSNFEWPSGFAGFGDMVNEDKAYSDSNMVRNISKSISVRTSQTAVENRNKNTKDTTPVNDNMENRLENNKSKSHKTLTSKTCSTTSEIKRQKALLELETERKRQQLEQEERQKQKEEALRLLELEKQLREAEIESKSLKSRSKKSKSQVSDDIFSQKTDENYTQNWVQEQNFQENIKDKPLQDNSHQPFQLQPEFSTFCNTLANAIQNAATPRTQDRRQIIEKDFPFFDGKAEEWPTFLYQFKRISEICQYTPEEQLIKLQKCLKGDAKQAVAGLLMSPGNLEEVIRTLERRFGRPDLIIDVLINKSKSFSQIREYEFDNLVHFASAINSIVNTITSLNYDQHLENPTLLRDLVQKLPNSLKLIWGEEVLKRNGKVNLQDFSKWITTKADSACYVMTNKNTSQTQNSHSNFTKINNYSRRNEKSLHINNQEPICGYCHDNHLVEKCRKIQADDVETRWQIVTKNKLCFSCLKGSHQTKDCKKKQICAINGCRRTHNKILHKEGENNRRTVTFSGSNETHTRQNTNEPGYSGQIIHGGFNALGQNEDNNILLRMVNVKLIGPDNQFIYTTALCDECSTVTLMDQSLVDKLNIHGIPQSLKLQWTNEVTSIHENSQCFDIKISGNYPGATEYTMRNVRSIKNLALPLQIVSSEKWKHLPHLNGLPISDIKQAPMILIGQDNAKLTVPRKVIEGPENTPMATKTNLGWTLHGKVNNSMSKHCLTFHVLQTEIKDDDLHKIVKDSFTIDTFGITSNSKTKNEERALSIMESTINYVQDRYEIGLLWKSDNLVLPESRNVAIKRLQIVEKQMQHDINFKEKYCENIEKYLTKNYARKLSVEEAKVEGPRTWYIPHFGVTNPNKPGKLRLVFDCAAKSNGVSLNDNLLAGPDLLASLIGVLLRFRERKIGFAADVREMFHQVKIREEDQDSQRFLWRDGNSDQPFTVYRMEVMTFGATCSPTCAQFVKNTNAQINGKNRRTIEAITRKHYVDDYLDSSDSPEEALQIITEVRKLQKQAGFELVSWSTSSNDLKTMLKMDKDIQKDLNLDYDKSIQRVLGMFWDAKMDKLVFQLPNKLTETILERPTKRQVLKTVMSIFDPLGILVNFAIRGRILIQDIWRTGIKWDDFVNDEIWQQWKLWIEDLKSIDNFCIPRCYSPNIPFAENIELHCFCDSSKKAFSSIAYLRVITKNTIEVCILFAKARVTPNRPITIPRLELQAALLGSRMTKMLKTEIDIKINKTYYWTDSTTVYHWIQNDAKKLGQFESHRVGEIQEITEGNEWKWVPSKQNPADLATRTCEEGKNQISLDFWIHGPEFLRENESKWPSQDIVQTKLKTEVTLLTTESTCVIDYTKFSNWMNLLMSTARLYKYLRIIVSKTKNIIFEPYMTFQDLEKAKFYLIRHCQKEVFAEEYQNLKNQKPLSRQSPLRKLYPVLNDQDLIVIPGRTNLAPTLSEFSKNPIILPKRHYLTRLYLMNLHVKFGHQGIETVLNEARREFWILDGRSEVKAVFSECQRCRRDKATPKNPLMGQLPKERLTPYVPAFTFTGIDYFGPFSVSVGRRHEKRWGVIFTCLTVRAVHLEIAHSMTTDSMIMALNRMIARRNQPVKIFCDNGTNLRGASEELRKAVNNLDQQKIRTDSIKKGIEWSFIPPASPHMGGVWERLIRTVKNSLYTLIKNQRLKDELLLTLFTEVENILNSRPITKISVDPNDFNALTPNHFLGKEQILNPCDIWKDLGNETDVDLRKCWRRIQILTNQFWKIWTKAYLPTLTKRSKWNDDKQTLKIDDVVMITEDNQPRNAWRLGRILEVFPGPDGRIRVAKIKTEKGEIIRPVNRLAKIEVEEN